MTDTAITLISDPSRYQDENGVWRSGEKTEREIFARVDSVSRSEFFAAGSAGLRPEYVFLVFAGEYRGETLCRHDGTLYAIYRTYRRPGSDELELYVRGSVGINGQG